MEDEGATMPVANGDSTPKPDPTTLTTDQVQREVELLKQLMDARFTEMQSILDERRHGVELAEREREKTARVAEQEREKAAGALRGELERRIDTGDVALREHITMQIAQVREALEASERLELERVSGLRNEMQLIHDASEEAIKKSETANERQFESVNEWRAQSADRERSMAEQQSMWASTYMPREVGDAQFDELRRAVQLLSDKVNKVV